MKFIIKNSVLRNFEKAVFSSEVFVMKKIYGNYKAKWVINNIPWHLGGTGYFIIIYSQTFMAVAAVNTTDMEDEPMMFHRISNSFSLFLNKRV